MKAIVAEVSLRGVDGKLILGDGASTMKLGAGCVNETTAPYLAARLTRAVPQLKFHCFLPNVTKNGCCLTIRVYYEKVSHGVMVQQESRKIAVKSPKT